MVITEELVRETLKQVIDPELFVNIVDLGLIYLVTVEPAAPEVPTAEAGAGDATSPALESSESTEKSLIKIEMTMTSPACPAGPQLIQQSKTVVGALAGVSGVEVKLVMVPPWTPERMTEDARDQLGIF